MRKIFLVCLVAAVFVSTASFSQSFSMYLTIDGIEGSSTSARYKNAIDILSYSTGLSSCPESTVKGGKTCKPVITDLNVMLSMDKAIIPLKMGLLQGKVFANADMVLEVGGTKPFVFMKIHMEDVVISSIQESGSTGGDSRPTVSGSFSFGRVAWQYIEQSADGTAGVKTSGGWDLKANQPFSYFPIN
jgi:type VI secretion system secreted protein Hcp